jgi:hypothetical protein
MVQWTSAFPEIYRYPQRVQPFKEKPMRRYLWLISFVLMASPAMADWTGKDASGAVVTFKNANACTSVVCVPIAQPVDSTGNAFGVNANPFIVNGSVTVIGSLPGFATTPTFNCGTGCGGGGGSSAITTWGTATLGDATAWGTPPSGNVIGVNANLPTVSGTITGTLPGSIVLTGMKDGITGLLSPVIGNAATGQFVNMTTVGGVSATSLIVAPSTAPVTATNPAMVTVFRPDQLLPAFASTPTFNCGTGCGINALGSTTSGQTGQLALGAVTTTAPAYTTSQTNALSLDTAGSLRVNVTTGTVTNAGTFPVQITGTANINNIAGTITLPTGASTSANQTSQITQETATAAAMGTTADAPCTLPATTTACTMEAVTKALANAATAAIPAGTAIIGKVGIDQTTPGTTNGVQVNAALPAGTNTIGATTSFGAYSTASITRSANTTTYTVNTAWNNGTPTFFSLTAACRANGTQVLIPRIDIWSSANPTLKLTGVLWLFSAVPGTNVSDDATFNIASADFANLTGSFAGFPFTLTSNQASGAANSSTSLTGATYQAQCASGSTTITGMVEVTNAYVPVSAEVLHVGIATTGVN